MFRVYGVSTLPPSGQGLEEECVVRVEEETLLREVDDHILGEKDLDLLVPLTPSSRCHTVGLCPPSPVVDTGESQQCLRRRIL